MYLLYEKCQDNNEQYGRYTHMHMRVCVIFISVVMYIFVFSYLPVRQTGEIRTARYVCIRFMLHTPPVTMASLV